MNEEISSHEWYKAGVQDSLALVLWAQDTFGDREALEYAINRLNEILGEE